MSYLTIERPIQAPDLGGAELYYDDSRVRRFRRLDHSVTQLPLYPSARIDLQLNPQLTRLMHSIYLYIIEIKATYHGTQIITKISRTCRPRY